MHEGKSDNNINFLVKMRYRGYRIIRKIEQVATVRERQFFAN